MIDDLSKRLLELEFKSNYSTKSKFLKWIVKKILPDYKEWKTRDQKQNQEKLEKKLKQRIILGIKITLIIWSKQGVKMKNKVLREKSKCVVCRSSKTRFLKQKHNSKKNQTVFQIIKIMQIYCQTCKKHTGNTNKKISSSFKE